jgi:uncharacterized membrane protein
MMFFGGGMLVIWLLVLAVIGAALGGLRLFNGGAPNNPEPPAAKQIPEDILRARYARGEISRDEYMQTRETLRA